MKPIILASASPRREELLKKLKLEFTVDPSNYEEDLTLPLLPHKLAQFLSRKKAEEVGNRYSNHLIIGADTLVILGGEVLGKPKDKAEARSMLEKLSGSTHSVITGFTIIDTEINKRHSDSVETQVTFKKLTQKQINDYLETNDSLDKAGAYAIQEKGDEFVEKINGDYDNVVGLPIKEVKKVLKHLGGLKKS